MIVIVMAHTSGEFSPSFVSSCDVVVVCCCLSALVADVCWFVCLFVCLLCFVCCCFGDVAGAIASVALDAVAAIVPVPVVVVDDDDDEFDCVSTTSTIKYKKCEAVLSGESGEHLVAHTCPEPLRLTGKEFSFLSFVLTYLSYAMLAV